MDPTVLVIVVAIPLALYGFQRYRDQAANSAAAKLAESHGLRFDPTPVDPPARMLLQAGSHDHEVGMRFFDDTTGAIVARHRHRVGSLNGNSQREEAMLALVPLPFNAPLVEIGPPTMINKLSKRWNVDQTELGDTDFAARHGIRDVTTGNAAFDERFQVFGADERFTRRLLHDPLVWQLSSIDGYFGRSLRFRFDGDWLYVAGAEFELDAAPRFLEHCTRVIAKLPNDLVADGRVHERTDPFR